MAITRIRLTCHLCGDKFRKSKAEVTYQDKKWVSAGKKLPKPYFCTRECGQYHAGTTYNECRSTKSIAKSLRTREAYKYERLKTWLTEKGVRHQFEHAIGDFIFDLALKLGKRKIVVEFDSTYHDSVNQRKVDRRKTRAAEAVGWEVHRVYQPRTHVIPVKYVKSLVL